MRGNGVFTRGGGRSSVCGVVRGRPGGGEQGGCGMKTAKGVLCTGLVRKREAAVMDMASVSGLNQTGLSALGFNTSAMSGAGGLESVLRTGAATGVDQYTSSDMMTFITEYNKLSSTGRQEVLSYLNEVASAVAAGGDGSGVKTDMPDFVARMVSQGIGGSGEEAYSGSLRTGAVTEENPEDTANDGHSSGNAADRGAQEVEQKDITALSTDQEAVVSDKGVVSALLTQSAASSDAATNAPQELQELAQKLGKDLSSVLERYLDSGCTEEAAYAQALTELRQQDVPEEEEDSGA